MLTGVLRREQAHSFANPLLQATLVPDPGGKGNPIGCSARHYSTRRQQRKVTQSFKGHYGILSRSTTQWMKTERELVLRVVVPLFWQPITPCLPQGGDCSFADSQRVVLLSYCSFHSL